MCLRKTDAKYWAEEKNRLWAMVVTSSVVSVNRWRASSIRRRSTYSWNVRPVSFLNRPFNADGDSLTADASAALSTSCSANPCCPVDSAQGPGGLSQFFSMA